MGGINELQGLIRYDIPDLWSRIKGESRWAFQLDDFKANKQGTDCPKSDKDIHTECHDRCVGQGF